MNRILSENILAIPTSSKETGTEPKLNQSVVEHKIEALKTLLTTLLEEVESLEGTHYSLENQIAVDRINLFDAVQRFEADLIRHALIRTRGNQRQAAKLLCTKISTLNSKIKRYGMEI